MHDIEKTKNEIENMCATSELRQPKCRKFHISPFYLAVGTAATHSNSFKRLISLLSIRPSNLFVDDFETQLSIKLQMRRGRKGPIVLHENIVLRS